MTLSSNSNYSLCWQTQPAILVYICNVLYAILFFFNQNCMKWHDYQYKLMILEWKRRRSIKICQYQYIPSQKYRRVTLMTYLLLLYALVHALVLDLSNIFSPQCHAKAMFACSQLIQNYNVCRKT